jgi:hypothetical protein
MHQTSDTIVQQCSKVVVQRFDGHQGQHEQQEHQPALWLDLLANYAYPLSSARTLFRYQILPIGSAQDEQQNQKVWPLQHNMLTSVT